MQSPFKLFRSINLRAVVALTLSVPLLVQAQLEDPLDDSISSIPAFFLAILDILLVFAIPFIVFFIIYAGFLYVTARGNVSVIEQAHRTLLYALIGGLLILGARGILSIITNTVNSVVMTPVSEEIVPPYHFL